MPGYSPEAKTQPLSTISLKFVPETKKNATVIKKTISISKNTLSVTYPTDDTGVECVLIQRHIHPRGEVAHRPVEMCRPGEVHQCTCKLAVRYDYDVQSSMLATYTIVYNVSINICIKWCSGLVVEYRTRNRQVAGSTHTRSTASNLEQVASLLCAQANSASYPQRDGK